MVDSSRKILFISSAQFGYNSDSYFYSKILSDYMQVTYIGFYHNKKRIENHKVNVIEVPFELGKFKSRLKLFMAVKNEVLKTKYDYSIIFYFTFSGLLKLFLPKNIIDIMDVRTSFITGSFLKNKLYNKIMKIELLFFNNVTIISSSLVSYLNIKRKTKILPLGAPEVEFIAKKFDNISLLYVGTFFDRNIENTIEGFYEFIKKFNYPINVDYKIIGFGTTSDLEKITSSIEKYNLQNYVSYIGEIRYPELQNYFNNSNIGVSYIPLTDYYQCQPPTKTFEYLLNGMPVLATATSENAIVINKYNGQLIQDNASSFAIGLEDIYLKRKEFNSENIFRHSQKFSWESIVKNHLIPYLEELKK